METKCAAEHKHQCSNSSSSHDAVDFSDVMEERRTDEEARGQSVHE